MIIKFKIQGVERVIKHDSTSFTAINPSTGSVLGYYSRLAGAVSKHIKDAGFLDENGKEEVLSLKQYVERYEKIFNEVLGLSKEQIHGIEFIEKESENRGSHFKKNSENKSNIQEETSEDDDEGL